MILGVAATATGEKLADGEAGALVKGLVEIFGGEVMNGEDFHVADLIDSEAVSSEGRGATEPFDKVAHLIGENVLISHGFDLGKGGGVENTFWSPEDLAGGSRGIDGIKETIG